MVMQWHVNKDDAERAVYTASWQSTQFVLAPHTDGRWHLWANGKHVKQNWPSRRAAMDDIETRQCRIIYQRYQQEVLRGSQATA